MLPGEEAVQFEERLSLPFGRELESLEGRAWRLPIPDPKEAFAPPEHEPRTRQVDLPSKDPNTAGLRDEDRALEEDFGPDVRKGKAERREQGLQGIDVIDPFLGGKGPKPRGVQCFALSDGGQSFDEIVEDVPSPPSESQRLATPERPVCTLWPDDVSHHSSGPKAVTYR